MECLKGYRRSCDNGSPPHPQQSSLSSPASGSSFFRPFLPQNSTFLLQSFQNNGAFSGLMFSALIAFLPAGNMNWICYKITASGMESVADEFAMCTDPAAPGTQSPEGNIHPRDNSGTQVFTLGKNWIFPFQVKVLLEGLKPATNLSILGFTKRFLHCQLSGFPCSFKANQRTGHRVLFLSSPCNTHSFLREKPTPLHFPGFTLEPSLYYQIRPAGLISHCTSQKCSCGCSHSLTRATF